jgi:molecular chaperone DnaK
MSKWAIDLGTTNTRLARWNPQQELPEMIHLEGVCREPLPEQEIEVQNSIPSCLYILPLEGLAAKIGAWPLVERFAFIGRRAFVGLEALRKDNRPYSPQFIPSFKPYLLRESQRALFRGYGKTWNAQQAARLFLRELFARVRKATGERPRELVMSVPVDSYEPYRAQLKIIASQLGVRRLKIIDEPVAAAIGYSLRVDEPQYTLVIDFGGGTLDIALVELGEGIAKKGRCRIIAKEGAALGGNLVDGWLADELAARMNYAVSSRSERPDERFWYRAMLEEACRLKESLYFKPRETFYMVPPEEFQKFEARLKYRPDDLGNAPDYTRAELVALLTKKGLYRQFDELLAEVLDKGAEAGVDDAQVREVLMTGGSTLLPGVYARVEKIFGRDKVRAWQPFEAIAYGACAFGADHLTQADFIVHDYAFVTYDRKTHEPEYNVIVPRWTPFPTGADFWRRQLVPTCPLGIPENYFKLEICEIGKKHLVDQEFVWDRDGQLHSLKKDDAPVIIPLNKDNPTLGTLDPPHEPTDHAPRLDLSFTVDDNRWLCVTVRDLKTNRFLKRDAPVLRLK